MLPKAAAPSGSQGITRPRCKLLKVRLSFQPHHALPMKLCGGMRRGAPNVGVPQKSSLLQYLHTVVPRHTSAPKYEISGIRVVTRSIFCFELRAKFEVRVAASWLSESHNTTPAQHPAPHSFSPRGYLSEEASVLTCARVLWLLCIYFIGFPFVLIGPKKVSGRSSADKKKGMMSIELKREIIQKHERGARE